MNPTTPPPTPATSLPLPRFATALHIGAREEQEDALGQWSRWKIKLFFAVVADGAGGHGGGKEASRAVIHTADEHFKGYRGGAPSEFLSAWAHGAHAAVNASGSGRSAAVALLIEGTEAHWAHLGDCRLYRFSGSKLIGRTRDHSVVQVLFEQGEIKEEEMGTHEDQNRLLKGLGGPDESKPTLGKAPVSPGDVFLLCSDGLWENLSQEEITRLAASHPAKWSKSLAKALRESARRRGPKADNGSAILVGWPHHSKRSPLLARLFPLVSFIVILFLASWLALSLFPRKQKQELPTAAEPAEESTGSPDHPRAEIPAETESETPPQPDPDPTASRDHETDSAPESLTDEEPEPESAETPDTPAPTDTEDQTTPPHASPGP